MTSDDAQGLGLMGRWLVARAARRAGVEPGHLLWVGREGKVVDLGVASRAQLLELCWSSRLAYRLTKVRDEKARLARLKEWSSELSKKVASGVYKLDA